MIHKFILATAILTATLQLAAAQAPYCTECRAPVPFNYMSCDDASLSKPPEGATGLLGVAVEANAAVACGKGVTVNVTRSTRATLPGRIVVELGSCLYWTGKPGDIIKVVVVQKPLPDGSYRVRDCN
jgi:hypothetical protein